MIKWFLYCRHLFQERNGKPKPVHEWSSDDYLKLLASILSFPDSLSKLEDNQEQVGLRNKVKKRHLIIAHMNCIQSNQRLCFARQRRGSSVTMTRSSGVFYEIKNPIIWFKFFHSFTLVFLKSIPVYLFQ